MNLHRQNADMRGLDQAGRDAMRLSFGNLFIGTVCALMLVALYALAQSADQRTRVSAVSTALGAIGNTVMTVASASPTSAPTVYSPYACSLRAAPQQGPRFRPLRLVRRLPFRPVPFRGNLGARQASDNP